MDLTTFLDKLMAFSYRQVSTEHITIGETKYLEVRLELKIGYTVDAPLARL
jgi:hypothetical protein